MGTRLDFLSYLGYDMAVKIFTLLDDPSDIARVSCVSRSLRDFVIANGLAKHLCLRMFPQLSRVDRVVEPASMAKSLVAVGSSNMEWETWKKEHRAYAFLGRELKLSKVQLISYCCGTYLYILQNLFDSEWVISTPTTMIILCLSHAWILSVTSLCGLTLHKSVQWFRKTCCRALSFQNLFFALVEYCRLSCGEMVYSISMEGCLTLKSLDVHCLQHLELKSLGPQEILC
ncbi:hypothetical protein SLA2020_491640 [Shorea laevis]